MAPLGQFGQLSWTELVPNRGDVRRASVLIDFDAAGGVDLDRLERSLELTGERVGHGRYRVTGGAQSHWVDLYTTAYPRCDCGDHLWRERICKHILAALLREGNDRVVGALGRLLGRWREGGVTGQPEQKAA